MTSSAATPMDFCTEGGKQLNCWSCWPWFSSLNFIFIYRGLSKGIETILQVGDAVDGHLRPVCVLVRVMTLDGDKVVAGLGAMWNPNPEELVEASRLGSKRRADLLQSCLSASASSSTTPAT
jgi:SNF family Na+-dependent transporter